MKTTEPLIPAVRDRLLNDDCYPYFYAAQFKKLIENSKREETIHEETQAGANL